MKKIVFYLVCLSFMFVIIGCNNSEVDNTKTEKKEVLESSQKVEKSDEDIAKSDNENKENAQDKVVNSDNSKTENKNNDIKTQEKSTEPKKSSNGDNIKGKVIDYIINGQIDKSEAQKIKWSKTFLSKVNIESLFNQYVSSGGNSNSLEGFAQYITNNAPIQSDWKELFKKDLKDLYGEKVVRLEHLKDDLYQAYIEKDGQEIPYVVVSSRTGYFHG